MKIIRIIKNPYKDKDLALSFKNNCIGYTDCQYKTLQRGLEVLQVDYFENEKFKQHWDSYYLEVDSDTTANKREMGWYDIQDVMIGV